MLMEEGREITSSPLIFHMSAAAGLDLESELKMDLNQVVGEVHGKGLLSDT